MYNLGGLVTYEKVNNIQIFYVARFDVIFEQEIVKNYYVF